MSFLKHLPLLKQSAGTKIRRARNERPRGQMAAMIEPLDPRVMLSVTALFSGGTLRITGDDQNNVITLSRNAGGAVFVNGGAIAIQGNPGANVTNINSVLIEGAGGNDVVTLDETNGALPAAGIFGGDGNDSLTGGSGDDFVDGGAGSDTISMGGGDDTFQWNPGDGSDKVDGGSGRDTMVFNGADLAEKFGIAANGNRVALTRDLGNVSLDLGGLEAVDLNVFGGADTITTGDQSATGLDEINLDLNSSASRGDGQPDAVIINGSAVDDIGQISSSGARISASVNAAFAVHIVGADAVSDSLTINDLGGNDTLDASALSANLLTLNINGGAGDDLIFGSLGNDSITGGAGGDKVFMGPGDDTFVWNTGDGSDVVEGQDGTDTLLFNGAAVGENIDLSADGARLEVYDDVGAVNLDLERIEQVSVSPLAGADNVVVNDLTGTAVRNIKVKLSADNDADQIKINGSKKRC